MKPFSFFKNENGIAIIMIVLILALLSIAGATLLHFSTTDIRISGNDRQARNCMNRVEAVGLHMAQVLRAMSAAVLNAPDFEGQQVAWIYKDHVLRGKSFWNGAAPDFMSLTEDEFHTLISQWGNAVNVRTFTDGEVPFLNGGTGRCLVVDCGISASGSQDIGGQTVRQFVIFSQYLSPAGQSCSLEMGFKRRM